MSSLSMPDGDTPIGIACATRLPACRIGPLLKGEERQRPLNGGRDRPQARRSAQAPYRL